MNTRDKIKKKCDDLKSLLLSKNDAYGNAALEPIGIFSQLESGESIKVTIDQLKYAFLKARESMASETDMLNEDLTEVFYQTLKDKITCGELIVIAVRGEVRTGKSTVLLCLMWEINNMLFEMGKREKKGRYSHWVFSDQTEFLDRDWETQ